MNNNHKQYLMTENKEDQREGRQGAWPTEIPTQVPRRHAVRSLMRVRKILEWFGFGKHINLTNTTVGLGRIVLQYTLGRKDPSAIPRSDDQLLLFPLGKKIDR